MTLASDPRAMYRARRQRAPLRPHRRHRLGKKHGRGAPSGARRAGDRRGRARARGGRPGHGRASRHRADLRRGRARPHRSARPQGARAHRVRGRRAHDAASTPSPTLASRSAPRSGRPSSGARASRSACYEAALLVENGVADMFRPLVVVVLPRGSSIERVRARDDASRDDAMARIRAQKPLAEKVAVADFVIDTTASWSEAAAHRRGAPGDLREARD